MKRHHKRKSFDIKDLSSEFLFDPFRLYPKEVRWKGLAFVSQLLSWERSEQERENHTNFHFEWKHILIHLRNKLKLLPFKNSSIKFSIFRLSFRISWYTAHRKKRDLEIEKWCEFLMPFLCFPLWHMFTWRKIFQMKFITTNSKSCLEENKSHILSD